VSLPCVFSPMPDDGLHLRLKRVAHYATSIFQFMVLLFAYVSQRNVSSKMVCLHNGGRVCPLWRNHTIYMNFNLQRATYITKPQITTKKNPRRLSLVVFAPTSHCATARCAPMLEKLQLQQNGFVTLSKKLQGACSFGSQRLLLVPPVLTLEKLCILDPEGL